MTAAPSPAGMPCDRLHDGFFARQIRTNFRILVRMIGFDRARETVAEIINDEADRRCA